MIGCYIALDHTFVLTESGLATINLKNCGRYFRSPSPSLYNAVQTNLKIVNQHWWVKVNYGGGKMRQHSNSQMHALTYIKTQWWGTSHYLRVSSKFLDIVFHDEIITPSSTNGLNRWFWCIQKQDPLSLCLNFCLSMDDIA